MQKQIKILVLILLILAIPPAAFYIGFQIFQYQFAMELGTEIVSAVLEERELQNDYLVYLAPDKMELFQELQPDYEEGYSIAYGIGDSRKPIGDGRGSCHLTINSTTDKPIEIRLKFDFRHLKFHWLGHWFPNSWVTSEHMREQNK